MKLSGSELATLVSKLPDFVVEDPQRVETKVFGYDNCYAIPKGSQALVFFTTDENGPACYLLERDQSSKGIKSACKCIVSFDLTIAAGTVVSGVAFQVKGRRFLSVLDIYQYAGQILSGKTAGFRAAHIGAFFRRIRSTNYSELCLSFGVPISGTTYKDLSKRIGTLPYDVSDVLYVSSKWSRSRIRERAQDKHPEQQNSPLKRCAVSVIAHPDHDVYELRSRGSRHARWAAVQTMAESQRLNRIFRIIRENDDLDYTEMSGDEETFENVHEMKYVKKRTMVMNCEYVPYLKKWRLLEPTSERISDESALASTEAYSTR